MKTKTLFVVAVVLTALTFVVALVPLWWWALYDMNDRIAQAWVWSWFITFVAATGAWVAWGDAKEDS